MTSALNRILTRIASSWPGSSSGGRSIRTCMRSSLSVHTLSGSISSGIVFSPHIPSLRRAAQNDAARLCSFGDTGPARLPCRSAAFARRIQELVGKNCASAEVGHHGRSMGRRIFLIVPWYRPGDYDAAVSMFGDLPASHAAWHDRALEWEGQCRTAATPCLRVLLRPDEFLAWCQTRQVRPDAEARSSFVVEKARAMLWPDAPADGVV